MYEDDDFSRRTKRRSGGGGIFTYLLLLAAVAGGIYYAWGGDFSMANTKRIASGDFSSFGKVSLPFRAPAIKEGETLQEKGKNLLQSALDTAVTKPKEAITNFIQDISKAATDTARKEATQVFGIPLTGVTGLPSNVSIVRPVQQSMSFIIGTETEDILYTVDWGDKQSISGTVPQKTNKMVNHAWAEAGDYLIIVETTGTASGKKVYSFPMTIQK